MFELNMLLFGWQVSSKNGYFHIAINCSKHFGVVQIFLQTAYRGLALLWEKDIIF